MKKQILTVIICVACVISSMCAAATSEEVFNTTPEGEVVSESVQAPEAGGTEIVINGQLAECTAAFRDNIYYLPARSVFEKIGSLVFYRNRDHSMMILSRDGDIIQHVVGTASITINGEKKDFTHSSFVKNGTVYLPIGMMSAAFRTNAISYGENRIKIQKTISMTAYGKAVNDAMYASNYSNFCPEKFKRYINYHVSKPELSMQAVVFTVNLGLDFPFYQNVTVISNPYNRLVLVNKYNQLPWQFQQKNLVNMDKKYTVNDGKKYQLESEAYAQFVKMADAARAEGISIRAISTYRTEDYQRNLYNKKVRATGQVNADNYSARPGFSEHQLGLAVDINSTKNSFEKTDVFKWLQNHAHEYGYILRYPKGQKWITGYEYEPWHYRYVGTDAATIIHREGLVYEQYYAKYVAVNEYR